MEGIDKLFTVKPWPWQLRGTREVIEKMAPGQWLCVCSPTGGGKSKIMEAVARNAVNKGQKVDLKVHRKLLLKQLMGVFSNAGVEFGVRSAVYPKRFDPEQPVQISSMPTEISRCNEDTGSWQLHPANVVIVDEAHLQLGDSYRAILQRQADAGAAIICVTATPIGMNPCKEIVVAGTNSELRRYKAHVPAIVKAPFELDLSKVTREKTGEFRIGDATKNVWSQAVVGSIIENWRESNPEQRPTLMFAPDVKSSIWAAEMFTNEGINAAHIDGTSVWMDGELRTDPKGIYRDQVMTLFREGEIKVLTNRYVMREGIDIPNIYHLILACPFGTLKTYIQAVGRVLRYSPETPDHVMITDHGGNIWRHGSPNMDRDWAKLFRMTEEELFEEQKEREKETAEDPPITCPKCGTVRLKGSRCPEAPIGCGSEAGTTSRVIIQKSGKLKVVDEKALKKKFEEKVRTPQELWDSMYWACKNSKSKKGMTFDQAAALFKRRHGFWPPHDLRNTPRFPRDRKKPIREVHRQDLK